MVTGDSIRGVCFDLWNTLAYTDCAPNPIAGLGSAFGLDGRADWRKIIERAIMTRRLAGITSALDALAAITGRSPSGGWSRRELVLMWGEASNRNRLFPDALPTLEILRGGAAPLSGRRYRLGIVSNTQSFDLDFMRREGLLALVDAVVLSCDCAVLKPDPAIFLLAAARMGLPAEQVLMVGDSHADDVEGARRAGMRAILLDRAGSAPPGQRAIRSLNELPAALAPPGAVISPS